MVRQLAAYETLEARSAEPAAPPPCNALAYVHMCHCWSPGICRWIVAEADAFGGWSVDRHRSVPTTDLEVLRVPTLRAWLQHETRETIFPTLATLYGFEARELRYMDLFLVRYEAATDGRDTQRGLRGHRDRSLLSFTVLLSDPHDFDGGGTRIDALGHSAVHPEAQGDLCTHCGKLRHAGAAVTRGVRYVLVGFVGVSSPRVDQDFVRSLYAKLNVESTARDLRILERALIRGGSAGTTDSAEGRGTQRERGDGAGEPAAEADGALRVERAGSDAAPMGLEAVPGTHARADPKLTDATGDVRQLLVRPRATARAVDGLDAAGAHSCCSGDAECVPSGIRPITMPRGSGHHSVVAAAREEVGPDSFDAALDTMYASAAIL